MSWIMTKRGSQDNIITYEHYCDTFSDLSNIPSSQVTLGSTAVVINDEDNGLGIYMANSQKEWVPISTSIGGGSGGITLDLIHICSSEEYNSSTKVPTIEDAEVNKIYLVPNNSSGNNLFDEWIYADDAWEKIGEGNINIPVSDVQVNGTSMLSNGVANIPIANSNELGVVQSDAAKGIQIEQNGTISINPATMAVLKNPWTASTSNYRPVVAATEHTATFYGLAAAAGDTTQSQSDNAVGTYTSEAKTAIQQMLDVPSNSNMSAYATKTDTVLETTLSSGRKENTIVGEGSFAFGSSVEASGSASHAEGAFTVASGIGSHAEGTRTIASGSYSHAENGINASGYDTIASGDFSHAEGGATLAAGRAAHSEGWKTKANGMYTHAEGLNTISNGKSSHAAGKYNIEDSYISWPEWTASTEYEVGAKVKVTTIIDNETTITGYICKTANTDTEFTASKWTEDAHMNYAHIVGNGTADNARSNAYALDWDGNGHYAGDIYVGCNSDSTGGIKLVREPLIVTATVENNEITLSETENTILTAVNNNRDVIIHADRQSFYSPSDNNIYLYRISHYYINSSTHNISLVQFNYFGFTTVNDTLYIIRSTISIPSDGNITWNDQFFKSAT